MAKIDPASRKIMVSGSAKKKDFVDERTRKNMNYSTAEGIFNQASGSIFDNYLVPFALTLNASFGEIGLLTGVQDLAFTFSQIPGAMLTDFYTRKAIWMFSQLVGKVLFWIPIFFMTLINFQGAVPLLIALVAIQTFIVSLRSPSWASLMGDVIPASIRGRYFGSRNMITGLAGIVMTLIAGVIVSLYGFSTIFFLYLALSIVAAPLFMKMYEPPAKTKFQYKHTLSLRPGQWKKTIAANKSLSIFTVYLVIMNFAILVASPFYTVYMLQDLHFSYLIFSIITILGALAHIVTYKYWGKINDRFGSRKTFIVTSCFGIFVPLFWALSNNVFMVAFVVIYDGVIFAGINQVAFNYLLDITPSDRRSQYVANHNFFVGLGIVLGAFAGGILATLFQHQVFLIFTGLEILFVTSFVIRIFAITLLPKINEIDARQMKENPIQDVFWQAMAVEPLKGLNNTLSYAFKYTADFEKNFQYNVKKLGYKIKMNTS